MASSKSIYQNIHSLSDISQQKDRLRESIQKDEEQIAGLWGDLFHPREEEGLSSPTQRIVGMMSLGTGVVDGLLLGWKLYRKFSGAKETFSLFRRKRRR